MDTKITLESIDKKFDAIDRRFDIMNKKFDAVDRKLGVMDKKIDIMATDIVDLKGKVDTMDKRIFHEVSELGGIIGSNFAKVDELLEGKVSYNEHNSLAERVSAVEAKFA